MNLLREYIREMLIEQNVLAQGMCFPFAYQKAEEWFENHFAPGARGRAIKRHPDLNDKSKFKVVHGTVTNKWKSPPKPVVHGWVEMGDLVFDDQTKVTKPNGISKEVYYDMYQPEIYKEFTAEEAILNCAMKGGEGPWDDDLYAMMQDRDAWLQEKAQRGQGKNKRLLYHINRRPAVPQPKVKFLQDWDPKAIDPDTGERTGDLVDIPDTDNWQRYWLDSPVKSGVFLTPNPLDIAMNHGRSGHVYAYKVPEWVIDKSGGMHRYDTGSEVLIPEKVWNEAGKEIEFLGKSMDKEELWSEMMPTSYGPGHHRPATKPSWMSDEEMKKWRAGKAKFNLPGLRATKYPEDVIKLLTAEERQKAIEAIEAKKEDTPGFVEKGPRDKKGIVVPPFGRRLDKKDEELMAMLKKHQSESLIREYAKGLLTEAPTIKLKGNSEFFRVELGQIGYAQGGQQLRFKECQADVDVLMQTPEYIAAKEKYEANNTTKDMVEDPSSPHGFRMQERQAKFRPRFYEVNNAWISDPEDRGKGHGKEIYKAFIDQAVEYSKKYGGVFVGAHACTIGGGAGGFSGGTSEDAQRVWKSLGRDYNSSGMIIFIGL